VGNDPQTARSERVSQPQGHSLVTKGPGVRVPRRLQCGRRDCLPRRAPARAPWPRKGGRLGREDRPPAGVRNRRGDIFGYVRSVRDGPEARPDTDGFAPGEADDGRVTSLRTWPWAHPGGGSSPLPARRRRPSHWAPRGVSVPKSAAKEGNLRTPARWLHRNLTVVFAGSSLQFERFRPAAENRGVPGSSPGLAIHKSLQTNLFWPR
jgi:hypothetical protein